MRERALAALVTAVVFAIGFGAGVWEDRHRPFPRPPGGVLGEFTSGRAPQWHAPQPVNRAQLTEQIDSIRPQMEAFRARMTLERMSGELSLDEAQRQKVKDFLRVRREKFIELVDSSPPLSLMLSRLAPIPQRLGAPAHR